MSNKGNEARKIRFNANINTTDGATTTTTTYQNNTSMQIQSPPLPVSYRYLWTSPFIVEVRRFIVFTSLFLLFVNAWIVVLWALRLIPSIPVSFLYYGFIWYLLFIFTGVLTLFLACQRKYSLYLAALVILFISLIVIIILNIVIIYNFVQCFQGNLDATCADFRATQVVLIGLSLTIGILIFFLFGLFLAIVVRLSQTYARNDPTYNQY